MSDETQRAEGRYKAARAAHAEAQKQVASLAAAATPRDELTAAWSEWQNADLYKKWRRSNPGEAQKLDAYRAGGTRPSLSTATGRALVAETAAWLALGATPDPGTPCDDWRVEHFDNITLAGTPVATDCVAVINFDYAGGGPAGLSDNFSSRFTQTLAFEAADYTFTATADDGVRVYVDNVLLIDKWIDQSATTYTATKTMASGNHTVKVEHYERSGGAVIRFSFAKATTTPDPQPISGFLRGHSSHGKSEADLRHLLSGARLDAYRDDALFESIYGSGGWGYLDGRMASCAKAGIKTFLVIGCYGSQDPATYASRCVDLVKRYGPGGTFWASNSSLTPVTLMIEVWNEPYMPTTYVAPVSLAAMCAAAVKAVHDLGKSVRIGPNLDYIDYKTAGNDYATRFVDSYPSGAPRPDFVASHPYSDPQSIGVRTDDGAGQQQYRFDRILKLRDTLTAKGWTNMPMMASEWGWSSASVGEAKQAEFAKAGFQLLKQWGVIGGFYYTGDRANTNTSDNYSQFGIMRSDGSDKPAVAAIGQVQT